MSLEECRECGDLTGRAGIDEDSLYAGDFGPYCEDCWYNVPEQFANTIATQAARIKDLEAALKVAEDALGQARIWIVKSGVKRPSVIVERHIWPAQIRAKAALAGSSDTSALDAAELAIRRRVATPKMRAAGAMAILDTGVDDFPGENTIRTVSARLNEAEAGLVYDAMIAAGGDDGR